VTQLIRRAPPFAEIFLPDGLVEGSTLLIDKPLFFKGSSKTKLVVGGRIEIKLSKFSGSPKQQSSPGKVRNEGFRLLDASCFQATPVKMFEASLPHEELAVVFLNTVIHRRSFSQSIFDREKQPHDSGRAGDDSIFTLHPRSTVSLVDCRVTCEDSQHCRLVCLSPQVHSIARADLPRLRMTSTFVSGLGSIGADCLSYVSIAESYFTDLRQSCFVLKSPSFFSISSSKFTDNHGNCFDLSQMAAGFDGVISIDRSEFARNSKHCVCLGATGLEAPKAAISISQCTFVSNLLESIIGEKVALSQLVVLECVFEKNQQECIMLNQVSPVQIDSCKFSENKSGCLVASNCSLTFSNNLLQSNQSGVRVLGSPVPVPSESLEQTAESRGRFVSFPNDITRNTFERVREFGIEVFGSPFLDMTIRSNLIRNCRVGILLSDNYPARLNLGQDPDSSEASQVRLYENRIVDNWQYGLLLDRLVCRVHIEGGRISNNHVFGVARIQTAAHRVHVEQNADQSKSAINGQNQSIDLDSEQVKATSNCALI